MADDDLRASLPDPPPPNASRREAAIGEAMRRFDGHAPAAGVPAKPERTPRRPWIRRPQFGALVTVGLMAVVGLPAAWEIVYRNAGKEAIRTAPSPPPAVTVPSADTRRTYRSPAPPSPERPPATADRAATQPAARVEPPQAEAEPAAPPTPVARAAPVQLAEAGSTQAQRRAPAYSSRAAPPAPPPPPPPPPPAPIVSVPPETAPVASPAPGDVVVTARRRETAPPARGDWNACTVEDPSRILSLCQRALPLSARGPKGVAAAHLADGLTRAWQGDMDGAIAAFDAAIAVAPKFSQAYLNRSLAYGRLGDDDRALADANAAVRHAPHAASAYYNRSLLLRRQGKIGAARADEDRAVEIDPDYEAVVGR
ncbi:tetratricopeptide repeat protein [Flavisphingomonas formosensis]|uniref:tetratricopeptide repeat protein n=1 Tax=Flavisphingomonas formosensis TaxID=861534 RepID=UPI0012F77891|nr:tetratricopeptide repeat protein [Sphingomonas formosensis]